MSDCVTILLEECGCTTATLADATCETLNLVKHKATLQAMSLIECVGQPKRVGDEVYDVAGDIEKLLKIVQISENLCRLSGPRVHAAFSLPANTCNDRGLPSYAELNATYRSCCRVA